MKLHLCALRWLAPATLAVASLAVITGCGGGGDATPTAGTTERAAAYTSGAITGFGSIIVNGVRFDDSSSAVSDDFGGSRSRSELKLGHMVEVDSAAVDRSALSGRALHIRFGGSVLGPVEAVNATAGTLTVLGQAVSVSSTTVFGDGLSAGLSGLSVGAVLEVHGMYDATTSSVQATRLEVKSSTPATYRVRGVLASLDATAKTFTVGGATINYATITLPADMPTLANGQRVRALLQTAQVNGQWVATAVRSAAPKLEDRAAGHLRGAITAFTSSTSFSVNDQVVDASAASFPDGTAGLALGAKVEVEGSITNGVLVATKVELDDRHAGERHKFELHGAITSIDTTAKTFVLRGVTVNYGGTVSYSRGAEADLAVGKAVEVKGTPSADRTKLAATSIKFES